MKRTLALLSFGTVLAIAAFAQSTLAAKAMNCKGCCKNTCTSSCCKGK